MEQLNNAALAYDAAGVLPMGTDATINGIHNEGQPSTNAGAKRGRGRPAKSAGSSKVHVSPDRPKRGRGRPSKVVQSPAITKKVAIANISKDAPTTNDDVYKRKRGRPSKNNTFNEQVNGTSKPAVQAAVVPNYKEEDSDDEPVKRKRGRPSGSSVKKAVVAPAASKNAIPKRKRGRPSGSSTAKSFASKVKVTTSNDGPAKKRGRPKKAVDQSGGVNSMNETAKAALTNMD